MLIKKKIITSVILILLLVASLASCHQNTSLTLRAEDDRMSGKVSSRLIIEPIFGMYLKNLDMFSGTETSLESLPTTITEMMDVFKNAQPNYVETSYFDEKTGRYTLDVNFDFLDFQSLAESSTQSAISEIISITKENGRTTIRADFNEQNRRSLEDYLPILLPMPENKNSQEKRAYFAEFAKIIVESQKQVSAAEKEIASSKIKINITTPRPITEILGGKITNEEGTQAMIEIPLSDIIYLDKDRVFSLTF